MNDIKVDQSVFTPVGPCVVNGTREKFKMTFYSAGKTYQFVSENGVITSYWKTGMLSPEEYKK